MPRRKHITTKSWKNTCPKCGTETLMDAFYGEPVEWCPNCNWNEPKGFQTRCLRCGKPLVMVDADERGPIFRPCICEYVERPELRYEHPERF